MKYKLIKDTKFNKIVLNEDYVFIDSGNDMSRVLSTLKNGAMMVSASRGNFSDKENLERTKMLEQDLRKLGLGYRPSVGGYKEEKEYEVEELSFLVPYMEDKYTEEEFYDIAVELCKKYGQDSVMLKLPGFNNGNPTFVDKYGEIDTTLKKNLKINSDEPYYTRLIKHNTPRFTIGSDEPSTIKLDAIAKYYGRYTYYVSPNSSKIREYDGNGFIKPSDN